MNRKKEILNRLIVEIESLETFIRRMKALRAQWEREDEVLFQEGGLYEDQRSSQVSLGND